MPFNEALFWFGLTAFGAGLYFLFLLEPAVKRLYSIGMTVIGALACAYSVYRYHHPESELPAIHLWAILLVLTWALLGYVVYIERFRRLPLKRSVEWREGFSRPRFEIVYGHRFENEEIVVDNKSFRRCSFKNVKLLFHGQAPFEFVEGTTFDRGTVLFTTDDPAVMVFNLMQTQFASLPGAKVEPKASDIKGRDIPLPPLTVEPIEKPKEPSKLSQSDPHIRIEVTSIRVETAPYKQTCFILHNEGGNTAYRATVGDIDVSSSKPGHAVATFQPEEAIPSKKDAVVSPVIDSATTLFVNDIVTFFDWELESSPTRSQELIKQVVVTYDDYTGNKFETTAELVYVPEKPETYTEAAEDFVAIAKQFHRKNPLEVIVERKGRPLVSPITVRNHQFRKVDLKGKLSATPELPLSSLQGEVIKLSVELLDFLKRIGPPPTPKYSSQEIDNMTSAQMKTLILANDGDFLEACEYYRPGGIAFSPSQLESQLASHMKRLLPWYQKVAASYVLELKNKVETMSNRLAIEGVADSIFLASVEGRDGEKTIRAMAAKLWELAFKLGEKGTR
jgi:hypothetical protein